MFVNITVENNAVTIFTAIQKIETDMAMKYQFATQMLILQSNSLPSCPRYICNISSEVCICSSRIKHAMNRHWTKEIYNSYPFYTRKEIISSNHSLFRNADRN